MPTQKALTRPLSLAVAVLVTAWLAGCATERLDAAAPSGVNLSGEWKFNPNLSDDPDKLVPADKTPQRAPGSGGHHGRGGGRNGGGGMPPVGTPPDTGSYNPPKEGFLKVGLSAPGIEQSAPLPPATTPPVTSQPGRAANISRYLQAAAHMSITQKEATVVIRSTMEDATTYQDEYTAGTQSTIPYGQDNSADRSVGWRGPVFVVTTKAKKGGSREDDFALDDDGRLIMTTQTKGGKLGKVEIKRVYDRVRG
jgi:hypothetical protein